MTRKLLITIFVAYLLTGFIKNKLPDSSQINNNLLSEPIQTETAAEPFSIQKKDLSYTINPLYNYELHGLVVSKHNAQSMLDYYHGEWNDSLNMFDICVLWGGNLKDNNFKNLHYKNGNFTCYVRAKSRKTWSKFNMDELSNNHLLVDDAAIAKILSKVKRGDQIYMKGYLAEYSHNQGFERGTSTSRTDKSGGACETVFLKKFEIIKKNKPFMSILNKMLKWMFIISVLAASYRFISTPAFRQKQK